MKQEVGRGNSDGRMNGLAKVYGKSSEKKCHAIVCI
jgi:hypothetical protein